MTFVSKRATGDFMTNARWIRHFVQQHAEYKKDSKVPPGIVYDLLQRIDAIEKGLVKEPLLFGDDYTPIDVKTVVFERRCQ